MSLPLLLVVLLAGALFATVIHISRMNLRIQALERRQNRILSTE